MNSYCDMVDMILKTFQLMMYLFLPFIKTQDEIRRTRYGLKISPRNNSNAVTIKDNLYMKTLLRSTTLSTILKSGNQESFSI